MKVHAWEFMNATASLKNPNKVNFLEERVEEGKKGKNTRLYRDVDLDIIGTHGWEMVAVVLVPGEEGPRLQYFFKRPSKNETSTIYEAADN
ncbi:hypothetical protein FRD01_21230 [Microvenator marinus]|jgi:hypothetical protein|uniref:Uncharacterized protein n=1 Tax=Microvenator marinus TaxID=2600177 RepID=A0A5B8XVU7_9DELT|nr:hypothetical protein [Microvenator marinus]QED29715.1 hypothetical protein FRD01_21230 [Microvenator marinus]